MTLTDWWPARNCHYCGKLVRGRDLHRDHFRPRSKGGSNKPKNIVDACGPCNSTKGHKLFADARINLMFRRLGWPTFKPEQLAWLRSKGFDLSQLENGRLYFEEKE